MTLWYILDILCSLDVGVIFDSFVTIVAAQWPRHIAMFRRSSLLRPYVSLGHFSRNSFLCLQAPKMLFLLKPRLTQNKFEELYNTASSLANELSPYPLWFPHQSFFGARRITARLPCQPCNIGGWPCPTHTQSFTEKHFQSAWWHIHQGR